MKFLKVPKNGHFSMGLVNGFCERIEPDIVCVFYGNYVRKDRFSIFWIENKDLKTKTLRF